MSFTFVSDEKNPCSVMLGDLPRPYVGRHKPGLVPSPDSRAVRAHPRCSSFRRITQQLPQRVLPSLSLPFPSPEPCLLQEACLEYPHLALALSQERFPESCTYVSPFRLAPGARLRFPPSWGLPEGKEGLPLLLFSLTRSNRAWTYIERPKGKEESS